MQKPWPKLSEQLLAFADQFTCQGCGKYDDHDLPPTRWQEHDQLDRPTPVVVFLCRGCADEIIEPHPRLYGELDRWAPLPGSMATCMDCPLREGVVCTHTDQTRLGGPGLRIGITTSGVMFIDGVTKGRRWGKQLPRYEAAPTCKAKPAA